MIKKFIYFILPLTAVFSVMMYSCSSDVYDEDDIIIVRDTVTIVTDTTIREQRETEKLRLFLVIQLAAFNSRDHADNFASTSREKLTAEEITVRKTGSVFAVTIGTFTDTKKAEDYLYFVKSKGFDKAYIRNIKY
jgi:cell division septation protein DedD